VKKEISKALELVAQADVIAVISHDRPDGDAIGSLVGLGLLLENIGKKVLMINLDGVPVGLAFLPSCERIIIPKMADSFGVDLIITVDCAGKDRIGDLVWKCLPGDKPVINVDHHASNTRFGDINLVDPQSPAAGKIIFEVAEHAGWTITRQIGENLYAAISTDTGSFRYPNTTAKTYRAAAAMIDAGVNVGEINQKLYESFPLRRVECLRDLLQEMKISFDGRCASVRLTLDLKKKLDLGLGDTEGVIDIIRAIDTVIVAVFFEELEGGKIRISSRSKTLSANVGKICASFGGGGHDLAAGARMKGPIEEAEALFLEAVGRALG